MELRDLSPRKDPKGGSPRTPSVGVPLRAYQQYANGNGNGTLWKAATCGVSGLFISMTVAWWTAGQNKGVTQKEMQEYVDKAFDSDRKLMQMQNSNQDEKIGSLLGHKDRIFTLLDELKAKNIGYDRDLQDHDRKIGLITNYIEAEKNPKR